MLGRATWAGSQRWGGALWSGDIHSHWAVLSQQFTAGLNAAMSGARCLFHCGFLNVVLLMCCARPLDEARSFAKPGSGQAQGNCNANMSMCSVGGLSIGVVYWATDIGGYASHDTADPDWRELVVRWFQWSALCPLFRLHGHTGGPCEPGSVRARARARASDVTMSFTFAISSACLPHT
jgi:alpha-glucosidase (family GH31 glycosyl hydrolase)